MFKCKVCDEKDKRIKDLQSYCEFLKRMVQPADAVLPTVDTEMNYTMEGAGREDIVVPQLEYTQEQIAQFEQDRAEEQAILSGTY